MSPELDQVVVDRIGDCIANFPWRSWDLDDLAETLTEEGADKGRDEWLDVLATQIYRDIFQR